VLAHWRRRLAPRRDTGKHPWTAEELRCVSTALCLPRWDDQKGTPLVQLLLAVEGAAISPIQAADVSRTTVDQVLGSDARVRKLAAMARNGGVDVSRWLPTTSGTSAVAFRAPKGQRGAADQPDTGGVAGTEQDTKLDGNGWERVLEALDPRNRARPGPHEQESPSPKPR
jgi:hypothetical protein